MDLHENSLYIYLDINKWEKIVAVEIREQSANMAHPNLSALDSSQILSTVAALNSDTLLRATVAALLRLSDHNYLPVF